MWGRRRGGVFDLEVLVERPGLLQFAAIGEGAKALFANEGGGHRWQRIPPTEKRGRVQTSTVTVAVMESILSSGRELTYADVSITTTKGSGPGGQNRNMTESCVIITHKASGVSVRIDNERSQHQNKAIAMKLLGARINEVEREKAAQERAKDRKSQVGSGMRGDKIRTYRTQDDSVSDHRTGQHWRLKDWVKGAW